MTADSAPKFSTLLCSARKLKGVSLREAAKETGISNAYICQLETGAIDEPSPHKLRKLAGYYGLSYTQLMDAAGYLEAAATPLSSSQGILQDMVLDGQNLTFDEAIAVASFLAEYRKRTRLAGTFRQADGVTGSSGRRVVHYQKQTQTQTQPQTQLAPQTQIQTLAEAQTQTLPPPQAVPQTYSAPHPHSRPPITFGVTD